jgi:hypothetical protein
MYEDQVFLAKVCVSRTVVIVDEVTASYRQHPASMCAGIAQPDARAARCRFLVWLDTHIQTAGIEQSELRTRIRKELWKVRNPRLARADRAIATLLGRRGRRRVREQ